ncbi:MAG: NADH-quinone oxidoreductase subunit C [Acidobacteriota bacterium]
MEEGQTVKLLKQKLPGAIRRAGSQLGDDFIVIDKESLLPLMAHLKEKPHEFDMLLDLTCVDYIGEKPRFEMVYHLFSLAANRRLRVKARLAENDLRIGSLTSLWKNANWLEREIYDLFGVSFEGHPDLRRLFMYDGFEGYPLRKDYPLRKRQPLIRLKE